MIERERMRVMAQQYVNMRNADITVKEAREYHGNLLKIAGGKAK